MKWSKTAALMGAVALLAWPVASQSLTEAAAKEKERRAKAAKAGKVYTDKELHSAGSGFDSTAETSDATATPSTDASPKPAGAATPSEEEEQSKKQDEWRKRRDKATADAAAWTEEAGRIQNQLNDNTQSPYGPARQAAVAALEEAKVKAGVAQAQLTTIEEEGRRNHYR